MSDTIVTLKTTAWQFPSSFESSAFLANNTWQINFTTSVGNYTALSEGWDTTENRGTISYNSTSVYQGDAWLVAAQRFIVITGGSDVEDADLILWLTTNATRQDPPQALVYPDQLNADLRTVADSIRAKTGGQSTLSFPDEFVDAIASIPTDTTELFECIYGTTTYAEITDALTAGKLPVCTYNNAEYVYVGLSVTNRYTFASQLFDTYRYISVSNTNSWGAGVNNFEITSNKVTSISTSSTDTQYPTAKLVYDQLLLKQDSLPVGSSDQILGTGASGLEWVDPLTESDIDYIIVDKYPIDVTAMGCTGSPSNPEIIIAGETVTLNFTFDGTVYLCPDSVTVTGASFVWTKNSTTGGSLALSNPVDDISVTVVGYHVPPVKGQIITMNLDGTDRLYRVLKNISGDVFEVLSISDIGVVKFDESAGGYAGETYYKDSILDAYMEDWYGSLNSEAQQAIQRVSISQDTWYWRMSGGSPVYTFVDGRGYTEEYGYGSTAQSRYDRHVYVPMLQDIIDYLGVTSSMTAENTTFTADNVMMMFWNEMLTEDDSIWLRDRKPDESVLHPEYAIFTVDGRDDTARINIYSRDSRSVKGARPEFQIDLSMIFWS